MSRGGRGLSSGRLLVALPWLMWLFTLALSVSTVAMALLIPHDIARRLRDPAFAPGLQDGLFPLEAMAFATVGALIVTRRHNLVGWLMCVTGITYVVSDAWAAVYLTYSGFVHPLPATDWVAWLNAWVWIPDFGLLLIGFPLLFPDGHPLTARWRRLGWVAIAYLGIVAAVAALAPYATADASMGLGHFPLPLMLSPLDRLRPLLQGPAFLPMAALAVAAAGSVVLRYRRAAGDERHQIKWVVGAFALVALGILLSLLDLALMLPLPQEIVSPQITLLALPISVGVAVFKYRLYDIDVVINRTLVYGALAAFISAVYVGIVVGIGTLIGAGGKPNLALSILATAVVAIAFQPVRERVQRVANRLVYGKRATPYEVLSEFSSRVAESYAGEEVLPRMAQVLAAGTGAEGAVVWLRSGGGLRAAAGWPEAGDADQTAVALLGDDLPALPGATRAVAVRHQGELLGALSVRKRSGELLTPIEEKLLDDLAHQAGLVLRNV
ncbi:MAG: hypothetical protein ABR541_09095, partial [Candidatus Dormibacteria bacterium]